jgi:hypothetical protein
MTIYQILMTKYQRLFTNDYQLSTNYNIFPDTPNYAKQTQFSGLWNDVNSAYTKIYEEHRHK